MEGADVRDAAEKHRELDVSLKTWGVYGVDDYSKLYEIEAEVSVAMFTMWRETGFSGAPAPRCSEVLYKSRN